MPSLVSIRIRSASTSATLPARLRQHDVARVDRGPELQAGADVRRLRDHQRHCLPLHVRAHQRAVGVVVLEERDQRRGDRDDLLGRDVHVVDILGVDLVGLAAAPAHEHRRDELAVLGDLRVGLRDDVALFLGGVEVDDLVARLALDHLAVGRLDEAVLRHGGVARERADQADVRALRGLDRAHAPVMGGVDVAHLDRRALAREAARAERREAAAVGEPGERVRLVHELRELRRAEELLQRRHDRADVDDRLRRDRVDVLGRHALAHDALHAVEADAEGLLDELADVAQPAVAEVLVLVELVRDRIALEVARVVGVVLGVVRDAEHVGQRDELARERQDVARGQHAHVHRDRRVAALRVVPAVQAQVELVAADLREVVALGIEEERAQERARVVQRRRLAGALLLEHLDQRLVGARRDVLLERVADVEVLFLGLRIAEEIDDGLVGRRVHDEAGRRVLVRERAQQRRDRQLALAIDADRDEALLVDLELEPRAARRHQVGGEELLGSVLGLQDVGARANARAASRRRARCR